MIVEYAGIAMRITLLGPVHVTMDGVRVDVGPSKQRAVLAILALAANSVVSTDQLIARIWGECPPRRARNVLATYVTRLRRALRVACDGGEAQLVHRRNGYSMECSPEIVDLFRFRRVVQDAALADGSQLAFRLMSSALDGWQVRALSDIGGEWFSITRRGLQYERRDALVHFADLGVEIGEYGRVVRCLDAYLTDEPFDELMIQKAMVCLHLSGHTARALEIYAETHRRFVDVLGFEPGDDLRRTQHQLLCRAGVLTEPAHRSRRP
ncbi:BTAD domain-containing putative transcriptional regulator [Solwaraspora sp. WMMD406]|uniref:AfsR/SARP family transcriptional regulator n=1 Tax=Solwaraspora sp. WMMD406 TaxID=3016095 RepID=UPI002417AD58|nr:BTAD domain-containing putative transcriptional regulator [Solwaraspora sp. WMMD406]MDG4763219.1 BTAD domain-containing putative transcriptional regulator [Solwaraspora sp. WMMD406]